MKNMIFPVYVLLIKASRMSPLNPENERISKKKCGKFSFDLK